MKSYLFDEEMLLEKVGQAATKYEKMLEYYKRAILIFQKAKNEIRHLKINNKSKYATDIFS